MNDFERLFEIVAKAAEEGDHYWTRPDWDGVTEAEKEDWHRRAAIIIKALQAHGYLNHRGYPPEEVKKYNLDFRKSRT